MRAWLHRRVPGLLFLLIGHLLFLFSLPPALGAWHLFQAEMALGDAEEEAVPDPRLLNEAAALSGRALATDDDSAPAANFRADLLVRHASPDTNWSLQEIEAATETAVRLSPADPYAWYFLAVADQADGTFSTRGRRALELSLVLGPAEGQLVFPRLSLCALNWESLFPASRDDCSTQAEYALDLRVDLLARMIASADPSGRQAYSAMLGAVRPDQKGRMERLERLVDRYAAGS